MSGRIDGQGHDWNAGIQVVLQWLLIRGVECWSWWAALCLLWWCSCGSCSVHFDYPPGADQVPPTTSTFHLTPASQWAWTLQSWGLWCCQCGGSGRDALAICMIKFRASHMNLRYSNFWQGSHCILDRLTLIMYRPIHICWVSNSRRCNTCWCVCEVCFRCKLLVPAQELEDWLMKPVGSSAMAVEATSWMLVLADISAASISWEGGRTSGGKTDYLQAATS